MVAGAVVDARLPHDGLDAAGAEVGRLIDARAGRRRRLVHVVDVSCGAAVVVRWKVTWLTTVTGVEAVLAQCVVATPAAQLACSAPSPGTLRSVVAPAPSGSVRAVESMRPSPSTTSPSLMSAAVIEPSAMSALATEPSLILSPVTELAARSALPTLPALILPVVTASVASSLLPTAPPLILEAVTARWRGRRCRRSVADLQPGHGTGHDLGRDHAVARQVDVAHLPVADLLARDRVVLDLLGADAHGRVRRAAERHDQRKNGDAHGGRWRRIQPRIVGPPRWAGPAGKVVAPRLADGYADSVKSF